MPELTSATLSQSGDGASTLSLAWRGWGPEWLEYMHPVALLHRGRVLFAGRVTAYTRSNSGGAIESRATVQDAIWLADHQTLGAQVAEIDANSTSDINMAEAAQSALMSWNAMAESCHIYAPGGWVVGEDGAPDEAGELHLDTTRAVVGATPSWTKQKGITAYTALLSMQQANPDAFYRYSPTTGALEVISIRKAQEITWDSAEVRISEITDVGPQYENKITGIALVVRVEEENGGGGSYTLLYPPDISAQDMGVHVITTSVSPGANDDASLRIALMMQQVRAYYDATNVLMHGGNVRARMEDVEQSPICCRLNLTGPGTHESWHTMGAMVTAVEWDFLEGQVSVNLGADLPAPNINEMQLGDKDNFTSSSTSTEETTTENSTSTRSRTHLPPSSSSTSTEPFSFSYYTRSHDSSSTGTPGKDPGTECSCCGGGGISPAQKILNSVYFFDMHYLRGINDTEPCLILQRYPELYVDGADNGNLDSAQFLALIYEYEKKLRDGLL